MDFDLELYAQRAVSRLGGCVVPAPQCVLFVSLASLP